MGNPFIDEPGTREAHLVRRTFEVGAGAILSLFGIAVLGVAAWALAAVAWTAIRHGTLPAGTTWVQATVIACAVALGAFATQVGFRLVWRRPNAHGSLLSPAGWATLAFVFAGVGAASSIAAVRSGGAIPVGLDFALLLFAAPCLLLARHLRRRTSLPR